MMKAVLIVVGIGFFATQAGASLYQSYKHSAETHKSRIEASIERATAN